MAVDAQGRLGDAQCVGQLTGKAVVGVLGLIGLHEADVGKVSLVLQPQALPQRIACAHNFKLMSSANDHGRVAALNIQYWPAELNEKQAGALHQRPRGRQKQMSWTWQQ